MTLYDIAQAYQTIFNQGMYLELTPFQEKYNPYTLQTVPIRTKAKQVFEKENVAVIKNALHHSMLPGGTGTHLSHLLPTNQKFYAKTGTSDGAKHGYTILCDGDILIVSFATYGKITGDHLELNDTPPIPYESGVRSAGILAAYIYQQWDFEQKPAGQVALK
jgi:membrane peptidoglycan carboxypeptidase